METNTNTENISKGYNNIPQIDHVKNDNKQLINELLTFSLNKLKVIDDEIFANNWKITPKQIKIKKELQRILRWVTWK